MSKTINFDKYADGLVPAVIQDERTGRVLMLGFMNAEAYEMTRSSGRVTFYSRSKGRLWTKGETSGNVLGLRSIMIDCDGDTLLIKAKPAGPVCHKGSDTCFGEANLGVGTLFDLEQTIAGRYENPSRGSYTASLFSSGLDRIVQKVGEEAVEVVIAAKNDDPERIISEAADLLYHLLILLKARDISFTDVLKVLDSRSNSEPRTVG